jgi:hypothetical protein
MLTSFYIFWLVIGLKRPMLFQRDTGAMLILGGNVTTFASKMAMFEQCHAPSAKGESIKHY